MGLPEILIEFKTQGLTAVQRSARGIVALVLKDDTQDFDSIVYKSIDEVKAEDWTPENKDYIEKTFMGTPSKILVERISTTDADYSAALSRLKSKKWNYLAVPGVAGAALTNIATWIKTERDINKKTFKAVLPNIQADHEGIINFATENIKVGEKVYSAGEYTCRIAGIMAGLPFTRSSTYFALNEVESIQESEEPGTDIDNGKLILINDGTRIKIGRGVNSLTTLTASKGREFKKIKIVDAVDLVHDDIRDTFNNAYVGKIINSYDNKVLFMTAVNAYFGELERIDVLDPAFTNKAELDAESQRLYLMTKGVDVEALEEQEIKEYNTDSKVFAKANVKFLDAMEDLQMLIYM
ncbi:phage tail sheath C-terminal domain-containing protein [Geosporobacter ferrireducens]|uniref:phage tail sheath C-terminal domain-containing protein n=1 Tax=Geosporobacter ferrireducens TaxID=1424294 RepID=UPI00139BF7FB|nr:phage tail sheath C-terminal domain-containing protein [Geosporobacter ferrireducens]MTI57485.1 phage tail sheath protein [Geosporobacter ferrireducens]